MSTFLLGLIFADGPIFATTAAATPVSQSLAASELLAALGLAGAASDIPAQLPGVRLADAPQEVDRFAAAHGIVIRQIRVPPRKAAGPPESGIDILRNELADTDTFQLIYSAEGYLDAIVPAGSPPPGTSSWNFLDLTPYYVDLTLQCNLPDSEWAKIAKATRRRRDVISEFVQFRRMSDRLRPVGALAKKPFVLATLDIGAGRISLQQFEAADFLDEGKRALLQQRLTHNPSKRRVIYPVFPTVYSPAIDNNVAQAENFAGHVHRYLKAMQLKNGDKVLDVGTGSGNLAWVAWATAHSMGIDLDMHAIDINPLAIANAKTMARLAGFRLTARVHDNVVDAEEHPAFPGAQFRFIIWDMPTIPRVVKPYLKEPPVSTMPRPLMSYWDDGVAAIETLHRFAFALPRLLAPTRGAPPEPARSGKHSATVLWNTIPEDGFDIVGETFRKAGLRTDLLDKYTSGNGSVTCVVYAVSLP